MEYVDRENTKQQPIMIHRAIFGSIERFFGILTEDCAGAFPTWLAPVQCRLLPVNSSSEEFCSKYVKRMKDEGIRADMVRFGQESCTAGMSQQPHSSGRL